MTICVTPVNPPKLETLRSTRWEKGKSVDYADLPKTVSVQLTQRGGHTAYIKNWQLESWVDDYARAFFSERLNS